MMIRFFQFLAIFALLCVSGASVQAESKIYLGGDTDKSRSAPLFNAPVKNGVSTQKRKQEPPRDVMAQMLEDKRHADYEVIKNESLRIREQVMEIQAARAAEEQKLLEAERDAAGAIEGQPVAEEKKEEKENVKKVYVGKSSSSKPKKVFNSYD